MSPYDIIVAVLLLWAAIAGYRDGLLKQFFSWIGFLLGLYLAYNCAPTLAARMGVHQAVVFVVICVAIPMACGFIVSLATRVLDWTVVLGLINHIGGLLLSVLKYSLLVSVVTYLASQLFTVPPTLIEGSLTYNFFQSFAITFWEAL